jgi:hypothetical protein
VLGEELVDPCLGADGINGMGSVCRIEPADVVLIGRRVAEGLRDLATLGLCLAEPRRLLIDVRSAAFQLLFALRLL